MIKEKIRAVDEVLLAAPIYTGTTLEGFIAPIFGVKSVPIFVEQFSVVAPQLRVVLAQEFKEISKPKVSIVLPVTKETASTQYVEIRSGQRALVSIPLSTFQVVQGEVLIDIIIEPELTSDLKFTNTYNYSIMDLNTAKEIKGNFQVEHLFSVQGIKNLPLPQKLALKLKELFTPNHVLLTESGLEEYIEYFKYVAQLYVESGSSIPQLKSSIDQLISELTSPSNSKTQLEKRVEIRRILAFMANLSSKALIAIEASYIEKFKSHGIEHHIAVMKYSASHIVNTLVAKAAVSTEESDTISVVTAEQEVKEEEVEEPVKAQSFSHSDTQEPTEDLETNENSESEEGSSEKDLGSETSEDQGEHLDEDEEKQEPNQDTSETTDDIPTTSEVLEEDVNSEETAEGEIEEETVASDEEQNETTEDPETNSNETEGTSDAVTSDEESGTTMTEEELEEFRRRRKLNRQMAIAEEREYTFNKDALTEVPSGEKDPNDPEDSDYELLRQAGSLAAGLKRYHSGN